MCQRAAWKREALREAGCQWRQGFQAEVTAPAKAQSRGTLPRVTYSLCVSRAPGQATLRYNQCVFLFSPPLDWGLCVGRDCTSSPVSPQSLAYSQCSANAC